MADSFGRPRPLAKYGDKAGVFQYLKNGNKV